MPILTQSDHNHFRKYGYLIRQDLLTQSDIDQIDEQIKQTVEEAVTFAKESALPDPEATLTDVYVDIPESEIWPFQKSPV